MPIVSLKNINKSFKDKVIFKDFSLDVEEGEFLSITGASGKGKTTLLNIIGLLEKPDSGDVFLFDTKNESFGSSIVNDWRDKLGRSYWNTFFSKMAQWDKITDDDLEYLDAEAARKLAYKRNASVELVWVDAEKKPVGVSTGNYSFAALDYNIGKCRNLMPIVRYSTGAYLIPDKFLSGTIRKEREEARNGALALKSEKEVRNENLRRYEEILSSNAIKDDAKYIAARTQFQEATEIYKTVFDNLKYGDAKEMLSQAKYLKEVSDAYDAILVYMESLTNTWNNIEDDKAGGFKPSSFLRKEFKRYLDDFYKYVKKFKAIFED